MRRSVRGDLPELLLAIAAAHMPAPLSKQAASAAKHASGIETTLPSTQDGVFGISFIHR
jgi:hypothetical protein